jgi:hypothetical protein
MVKYKRQSTLKNEENWVLSDTKPNHYYQKPIVKETFEYKTIEQLYKIWKA